MICLNSLIEPTTRARTMFLQVGASTPVVSSCEVVRIVGVFVSTSWNRLRWPRPMSPFVRGDAAHVIGMLCEQVGVQVRPEPRPHLAGVFLIDAEDDGLGERSVLPMKLGQVTRQSPPCAPAARPRARSPWSDTRRRESRGRSDRVRSLLGRQPAASHSVMTRCTRYGARKPSSMPCRRLYS